MSRKFNVAVVGATGAVGEELFRVLDELDFPINELLPLASANSVGKSIEFKGSDYPVVELTETVFEENEVDIAFFSAGGSISEKFAKYAVEGGAVVIDNTSHFRMDPNVPLVVPEVNPEDIELWRETGIIANPNCSTIQMLVALFPIHKINKIKKIIVSTYQSVSGAGQQAINELTEQSKSYFSKDQIVCKSFPKQIAYNVIPQIDIFTDNKFTKEEMKMVNETNKILDKNINVNATCVRVPSYMGHAESIYIELEKDMSIEDLERALQNAEGIKYSNSDYHTPIDSEGEDWVYVSRLRKDIYKNNIFNLWVVADNLLKGAALNSVQIGESLIKKK